MSYTCSTQTLNDPCLLEFKKGVFLFSYLVKPPRECNLAVVRGLACLSDP